MSSSGWYANFNSYVDITWQYVKVYNFFNKVERIRPFEIQTRDYSYRRRKQSRADKLR